MKFPHETAGYCEYCEKPEVFLVHIKKNVYEENGQYRGCACWWYTSQKHVASVLISTV